MSIFAELGKKKMVIGLIHLKPLPGTPLFKEGNLEASLEKAIHDAQALSEGGADGCLVQTVDKIYPSGDDADYARVAAMAVITREVRKATPPSFLVGAQIMWNCNSPTLAVAKVAGASFIRSAGLIGTTVSPFGLIDANPLKVQEYRKYIEAQNISIIAEIEGYHYHWLGGEDISIVDKARMAMMAGADAVEVLARDEELNNKMVHDIKKAMPKVPVILGGGTCLENVSRRLKEADGVFVGSCFENKNWGGNVDKDIVKEYMQIVRKM
jgi:membrane complex biogenesis BtpA family protein